MQGNLFGERLEPPPAYTMMPPWKCAKCGLGVERHEISLPDWEYICLGEKHAQDA